MKIKLVDATWPGKPKTNNTIIASNGLAAFFIVMATLELFRLDNLILLFDDFAIPGLSGRTIAVFLVVVTVFAIPYLLRMKLSPAMRGISFLFGWLAILGWLFLSLWTILSSVKVHNLGLFGSEVVLIPGWWSFFVVIGFGLLMTWATWGMPPDVLQKFKNGTKKSSKQKPVGYKKDKTALAKKKISKSGRAVKK